MKKRIPWKVLFAAAMCICMSLQFMPVFGEDDTVQTTDWTSSGTVQADLEAYEASGEGISFDLSLSFSDPETRYQEGDILNIGLPSETVWIQNSAEPMPVYGYLNDSPSELIGTYTVQNGILILSFSSKAEELGNLTSYTGKIHLEAALPESRSGGSQYAETVWAFPAAGGAQNAVVRVPTASVMSWTGTDPAGMVTMSVGSVSGNGSEASVILTSAIADGASASYSYALPGWADALQTSGTVYAAGGLDVSPNGSFSVADHVMTVTLNDAASGAEMRLPFTWADRVSTPLPAEETATPVETAQPEETAVPEETVQPDGTPEPENPSGTALPAQTENPAGTAEPENTVQPEPASGASDVADGSGETFLQPDKVSPSILSLTGDSEPVTTYGEWIISADLSGKAAARDVYWIDNNNGEQTRPSDEFFKGYFNDASVTADVTIAGGEPTQMTLSEILDLLRGTDYGITDSEMEKINHAVYEIQDLGGTGHWQLSASALPSKITLSRTVTETDAEGNVTSKPAETKVITFQNWSISFDESKVDGKYSFVDVRKNDKDQYVDQHDRSRPGAMGVGWYFVEETTYSARIVVRRGTNAVDKSLVDKFKKAIMDTYSFCYATGIIEDGKDINSGFFNLSDVNELENSPVDIKLDATGFGNPDETSMFTIAVSGLEKYNLDGSELIFNIDRLGSNGTPESGNAAITEADFSGLQDKDYLAEEIVNDTVSNHGTNTTELYSGGTMYLTLTGYTDYTATKYWQDADRDSAGITRPRVSFELWRYTLKSGTAVSSAFKTASPVKATKDAEAGTLSSLQTATFVISEGSKEPSQEISFASQFEKVNGFDDDQYLPKYDPEGFTYVYFTREEMSGDGAAYYRTEFGNYDPVSDSFVKDVLPAGYGKPRTAEDNSLYNDGVISNVLTDTTAISVEKNWIADAFQSELADVTVVFQLQKKYADEEDAEWMNVDGKTAEMSGFSADVLSRTYTESLNKYDNTGRELEYRWVESLIRQNGTDIPIKQDGSFSLTQNKQLVEYISSSSEPRDGMTSITNTIQNVTEFYVDKEWGEGTIPSDISLSIYRTDSVNTQEKLYAMQSDGTYGDIVLPYPYDETMDRYELFVKDGDQYKKAGYAELTDEGTMRFYELDKYDMGGAVYDYFVLEGNNSLWHAEYSMTTDDNGIRHYHILNLPGEGSSIYVRKRWLDDGDEQHRNSVTFTLYAVPDDATADSLTFSQLTQIREVTLNRDNTWWAEVSLTVDGIAYSEDRVIVLETKVGDKTIDSSVYTDEVLRSIYRIQKENGNDNSHVRCEGDHHEYEASYSMVNLENLSFYTITNRRLDTINITVKKQWADGSSDGNCSEQRTKLMEALEDKGYALALQLVPADSQSADATIPEIAYSWQSHPNTVKIGNEYVPIQDNNGYSAGAIQPIKADSNESEYYFFNLPKYDLKGKVVRYSVKEIAYNEKTHDCCALSDVLQDVSGLDYSFSMQQTSYISHELQPDEQEMTAVNRLTGSKNVHFWKEWNDAYRLNLGQRPDIYLDLYRKNNDTDQLESVYRDKKWSFTNENVSYCDFGSLPKYDEQGREILYYAKEQTFVNKTEFDYKDVYYKYPESDGKSLEGKDPIIDETEINSIIESLSPIGNEKNGYAANLIGSTSGYLHSLTESDEEIWLLKEGGVFVNDLSADAKVSGKKIWANVPIGFLESDMLPVTFYLFQFVNTESIPGDNISLTFADDGKVLLAGKEAKAWLKITEWEEQNYQNNYNFELDYIGGNTNHVNDDGTITVEPEAPGIDRASLPKYDDEGNLYTYVLRESADFSGTDAEIAGNNDNEKPASYVFRQPSINNYAITNTYSPKKGEITVRKYLDTGEYEADLADGKNVIFTFTLTREYVLTPTTTRADNDFKIEKTVTFKQFADKNEDIVFEDLEIYAPNGNRYIYTVTENTPQTVEGGFTVYAEKGLAENCSIVDDPASYDKNTNSYSYRGLYPYEKQSQDGVTGFVFGALENLTSWLGFSPRAGGDDEVQSQVTFRNKYTPGKAQLSFDKKWNDGGLTNLRLNTPMTFEVRFSADSQPGQSNAIVERNAGTFEIDLSEVNPAADGTYTVNKNQGLIVENNQTISLQNNPLDSINTVTVKMDESNNTWTISVNGLPVYAPNGMTWEYILTETDVYPYVISNNSRVFEYNEEENQFIATTPQSVLTNSIYVNMQTTKNPRYSSDPNNDYSGSSTEIYNETGFDVLIEYELYAKFVTADTWEEAQESFVSNNANSNVQEWISLYDNPDNPYVQALSLAANKNQSSFTVSHTFNNGTGFGKKSVAIDNLPRAIQKDGKTVFVTYILLETEVKLIDPNNKIIAYQEAFEPHFVYTKVPDGIQINRKDEYESGESVVAYYFKSSAQICGKINGDKQTYEDTQYLFMKPLFGSESDVTGYDGEKKVDNASIWTFDFDVYEEWLPYIWIDRYDEKDSSKKTFINDQFNLFDTVEISVEKEWVKDHEDIYNTRPVNAQGKWVVDYQLQQSPDGSSWVDFTSNKYAAITEDSADSKVTYTHLPADGIFAKYDDGKCTGYTAADNLYYRVLEKNIDNTLLNENETFNEAYKVTYAPDQIVTTASDKNLKMTNTLITIDIEATKKWNGNDATDGLTSPVTFELQYEAYVLNPDGTHATVENENELKEWKSFDTSAKVHLDGTADTETDYDGNKWEIYYEDTAWHAVWKDVPKAMPGSVKDVSGQTNYRVVEVVDDNNAYSNATTTEAPGGSSVGGTEGNGYILKSVTSSSDDYDLGFEIENDLTELKISKTIEKPSGATLNNSVSGKEFTFTITDAADIPDSAKYRIFSSDGTSGNLQQLKASGASGTASFKLQDGQYAVIYGLKKGKEYTVTETHNDGYAVQYQINSESVKYSTNDQFKYTVPKTKPADTPKIAVTNERLGSITINKTDADDKALSGISFKLEVVTVGSSDTVISSEPAEYFDTKSGQWKDCSVSTTGNGGKVVFSNLSLDLADDQRYRLVEVSAPGYHKYPVDILFDLPYSTDSAKGHPMDGQSDQNSWFYEINGINYYPDISITIENDKVFIMPQTAGSGIFWPGIAGAALAAAAAGIYLLTRKRRKEESRDLG